MYFKFSNILWCIYINTYEHVRLFALYLIVKTNVNVRANLKKLFMIIYGVNKNYNIKREFKFDLTSGQGILRSF